MKLATVDAIRTAAPNPAVELLSKDHEFPTSKKPWEQLDDDGGRGEIKGKTEYRTLPSDGFCTVAPDPARPTCAVGLVVATAGWGVERSGLFR